MRKYNKAITEREIRFEHALVDHINAKGFHLAARVYPNKRGETFVAREETAGGERLDAVLRGVRDARGPGQVHLGEEPLHRRGVRDRWPRAGPVPLPRARLRPEGSGARAAAHHAAPARPASRLRGLRRAGPSREQRRRPVLPGMAARHRRGAAQGRRAGARAAGDALHPGPLRLPSRQPQVGRSRDGRLPARPDVGLCAPGCSTSTGPSSTTASSTWPRASCTSAAPGRATTAASSGSTRPPSSCAPTRTRPPSSPSPVP